ncbi:octaprenyl-diphosphate synthase [Halospina denitrificans]|uniref:Octaprenyl diphosphate synthase n=1 Tax=Halospina denitrificans TaxID=332522 RepID=A0A4R7JJ81_9GAMM|nr:octaprenyl diphosphate synthase [Halospina denitrificans]TDT37107.1 octaprenyl-diphosphate synthase [Halospina denitrificans]
MSMESIYNPVRTDFEQVNALIHEQLTSHVPLVEHIGHYIVDSGGKRLRPLLVLLSAGALDYRGEQHAKLAAVIEFLHTATLLHDDVVDTSELRRGRTTANARWGNAPSVLVGDFLYSRSFQMMVEMGSMRVMELLSDATAVIAEGEVLQLVNSRNPDLSEEQYMTVIHNKTAMLFQAASHSAGVLAEADPDTETALRNYGCHLGLAFQIVDDVLDYQGDPAEMGKNVGDDLAEGKATLPLIHAMATGTAEQRTLIRKAIREGGLDNLAAILEAVQATGALEYSLDRAREHAHKARSSLEKLPPSPHRDAMSSLINLAVDRAS